MKKLINKLFLKLGYVPKSCAPVKSNIPYSLKTSSEYEICVLKSSRELCFPTSHLMDPKEYGKQQERQLRQELHYEIDKFVEKRMIQQPAYLNPIMEVRIFIAKPKA